MNETEQSDSVCLKFTSSIGSLSLSLERKMRYFIANLINALTLLEAKFPRKVYRRFYLFGFYMAHHASTAQVAVTSLSRDAA